MGKYCLYLKPLVVLMAFRVLLICPQVSFSVHNGPRFGPLMPADFQEPLEPGNSSKAVLEQVVQGSRRPSNYIVGSAITIGGIGFSLASLSSYKGQNFLPIGDPASLIFVPQGLIMGLYGITGFLIAIYLWTLVAINFGGGLNRFDKNSGSLFVSRRGIFKEITLEVALKDVKAVKLEVRDGINPRRRIALRIQGRSDLPLTRIGQPMPLGELEQEGAQLARFLEVNLEGL